MIYIEHYQILFEWIFSISFLWLFRTSISNQSETCFCNVLQFIEINFLWKFQFYRIVSPSDWVEVYIVNYGKNRKVNNYGCRTVTEPIQKEEDFHFITKILVDRIFQLIVNFHIQNILKTGHNAVENWVESFFEIHNF